MSLSDPAVVLTFAALFGLAVGSFVNVLVIRTHRETSPWFGRSKCVTCGHQLAWFDNIPLLSFGWLRGRCRYCKKTLSWQYPLVEAGTALVFMLTAHHFGATWWTPWGWLVAVMMIAIAVYDARWSLLPDSFSISLAIVGGSFAVFYGVPWQDLLIGAAAGALFFGLQFALSRGRWVGSGDIFLGGALGLLLGWRMLGLALLLSYFAGAIVASILLLLRKQKTGSAMAFGPYLVFGGFVAWLWGQPIIDWYFNNALFR